MGYCALERIAYLGAHFRDRLAAVRRLDAWIVPDIASVFQYAVTAIYTGLGAFEGAQPVLVEG